MNVNCGCAATKLSLLSLRVEMWASHETISRKPATFRKLKDLSSVTSRSSRKDRNVKAHRPNVTSTSTTATNASPNAPAIAYFGL